MLDKIIDSLRGTSPYNLFKYFQSKKELRNWEKLGRPVPPPHSFKVKIVKEYAIKYSIQNFIETGTYRGNMIYALKDFFRKIYSIELDAGLYKRARQLFAKYDNITIIQGDSGELMPRLLAEIKEPSLFWLDAHYSGAETAKADLETPIIEELTHIMAHNIKNHVVLIDDAHCFFGKHDYPKIEMLKEYILINCPDCQFDVMDDIIRICL